MSDDRQPGQASRLRRTLFPAARRILAPLRLEPLAARAVVPHLRLADPSADLFRAAEARLGRELTEIVASDRPVLVGPWLSEVGFEILYWLPFVRRLVRRHGLDPARLVAVSRGGVASWYDGVCEGYVDVFDLVDEDEFRTSLREGWIEQAGQKQFAPGSFDRRVADAAAARAGLDDPLLLHPSLMYGLFSEYWLQRLPLASVLPFLEHAPLRPPVDDTLAAQLPDDFVAARFYFRETFPDTPENRSVVSALIERLAGDAPVVLLDTDIHVDDHVQVPVGAGAGVLKPLAGAAAAENLRLQSAVLGRARAFVGTYGGLCYLANAYGVPALALVTPPAKKLGLTHTAIARRLSAAGGAPLSIVATSAVASLSGVRS